MKLLSSTQLVFWQLKVMTKWARCIGLCFCSLGWKEPMEQIGFIITEFDEEYNFNDVKLKYNSDESCAFLLLLTLYTGRLSAKRQATNGAQRLINLT